MTPETEKMLRETFVEAAQTRYDYWEQNEEGLDPEIGSGGICSIIADEAVAHFLEAGYDAWPTGTDEHCWVAIEVDGEVLEVDIPCSRYEIGAGYNWKKIPDVQFTVDDVLIWVSERDTVEECAHLM